MRKLVLLLVMWVCYPIYAQQNDILYVRKGENGKIRFARFEPNENSDRRMDNDTVFLKSILQAKAEDQFRLKSVTTDKLGMTHKRFQQYYRGIKVENAEYLLHGRDNHIEYINGDFQDIHLQTITPMLNEQQSLRKALEYVGAEKYKWEDPNAENFIKQHRKDPNATCYPQGELVIAKDYLKRSNLFTLAWKFSISSLQPYNAQMIFVDATNGEIIQDNPLIISVNSSGTAETMYSGTQNITCDSDSNGYKLRETRNTTPGNSVTVKTLLSLYPLGSGKVVKK